MLVNRGKGYIEEKGVNKYLIFYPTDENNRIKNKIKKVSSVEYDYEKDYMKIKFNSDDNLPLNKPLKFHNKMKFLKKMVNFIHKIF